MYNVWCMSELSMALQMFMIVAFSLHQAGDVP